ncbi:MAG: Sir2 histone deacetylase Hst2 [Thelocarpon superellum]|nr:MAG: Sir2 histone deacetylase Hst2 [Thelocarpon superellum]
MGQESSLVVDEHTEPQKLERRDVPSVAKYINGGRAKRIVVMAGAGISTSAGIPDFRSPDTGLYANLARLDLPFAEAVFDISYFRQNPLPFYALAHELYPGKYRPTVTHSFIRLLHDKGLLLKLFTQNIDCLEREAGVPDDRIVEAHGSFATQRCIECKTSFPDETMKKVIREREVPHCVRAECGGLVKPDIVFFGEQLPENFHQNRTLPAAADLCLVMGTSLSVQPFASLPGFCSEGVPRLLINRERVGGLGSRADDVLLLEDCDDGVRRLASALGWLDELEQLWQRTNPDQDKAEATPTHASEHERLEAEIEKLTGEVDQVLKLSGDHDDRVRVQLDRKVKATSESKDVAEKETVATQPETRGAPATAVQMSVGDAHAAVPTGRDRAAEDTSHPTINIEEQEAASPDVAEDLKEVPAKPSESLF